MYATVDEAIAFIVEALKDPLNPRWCAPSIVGCMVMIQPDTAEGDDTAKLEALINRNHLFGSTIVAFLTAERSLTAINGLASGWSKCNCSYADFIDNLDAMPIHQTLTSMVSEHMTSNSNVKYGKDGKFDVLKGVVRNFARFFESAVGRVKPLSISKGRHPEIWPATPKDIIPYGE
jgi:hypothetical protein